MSDLPAMSESIVLKVIDLLNTKVRDVKGQSFEQKQIFFDRFKSIMNFLLVLPDSPETDHFKNLSTVVGAVKKMELRGDDKMFEVDLIHCAIHHLAVHHQDRLPFRLKLVKSNDQLYRSADYKEAIIERMMEMFEDLFTAATEVHERVASLQRHADVCHASLKIVHTLALSFDPKAVINKLIKLCLSLAGDCIKQIKNKGDKRRTVRHLKRTIRECYLEDNPKLVKLAASLYTFFDGQ